MRLRIVSDGTPMGTRVLDERGETVQNVAAVTWTIKAEGTARATLELINIPVEVVGEKEQETMSHLTCPICDTRFLLETKNAGRKGDYLGSYTRWKCSKCGKHSYSEDWFDTSGMN